MQTFLSAILVAFIGFIPPGMLNMTALKNSLDHGRREAFLFVSGAVTVIFLQALIAVTFAKFLVRNPHIVENLTYGAIVVFLALSLHFFRQARRKVSVDYRPERRNSYLAGLSMSMMNMLGIPFFLSYCTLLEGQGWLSTEPPLNVVFALGAMIGAFILFWLYVLFAGFIQARIQFVARNINYILSLLFLTLLVLTLLKTL